MKQSYLETIRLIERLHRRFLDVIKTELDRLGIEDINNVQTLILSNISSEQLTVGELTARGYYLGSNVSYNVKKLVENGYLNQERSPHDRRMTRVRVSEKGLELCERIDELYEKNARELERDVISREQLTSTEPGAERARALLEQLHHLFALTRRRRAGGRSMVATRVSRFDVPALDALAPDLRARIEAVRAKTGFIPNVFLVLARRPDEFRAFFAYYDALMLREGGLSKAEKEMIVVATSAANQCPYCVVAHGALLRLFAGNPRLRRPGRGQLPDRRDQPPPAGDAGGRAQARPGAADVRRGRHPGAARAGLLARRTSGTSAASSGCSRCPTGLPICSRDARPTPTTSSTTSGARATAGGQRRRSAQGALRTAGPGARLTIALP